jgi:hypothetical protein
MLGRRGRRIREGESLGMDSAIELAWGVASCLLSRGSGRVGEGIWRLVHACSNEHVADWKAASASFARPDIAANEG